MSKHYSVEIFDIDYDQDGEDNHLPERLKFSSYAEDLDELEELMADFITDKTGFCHKGFNYQIVR